MELLPFYQGQQHPPSPLLYDCFNRKATHLASIPGAQEILILTNRAYDLALLP